MISIIIPTFNNEQVFLQCLTSIVNFTEGVDYEVIVVLNGEDYKTNKKKLMLVGNKPETTGFANVDNTPLDNVRYIKAPSNLGWMGGINLAKNVVKGEYILLLNDDTQIPDFNSDWLLKLKEVLDNYSYCVAVAPVSSNISGEQNTQYSQYIPRRLHKTSFLSGCCVLLKKDTIDKVGWLDENLCGGDDIDLSIRLMDNHGSLFIRRDVHILHKYATTGKKLYGEYWDSRDHSDNIQMDLIRKHGLKRVLLFNRGYCN